MKRNHSSAVILALLIHAFFATSTNAQPGFGDLLNKAKKKVDKATKKAEQTTQTLEPSSGEAQSDGAFGSSDYCSNKSFYDESKDATLVPRIDINILKLDVCHAAADQNQAILVFGKAPVTTASEPVYVFKGGDPIFATATLNRKKLENGLAEGYEVSINAIPLGAGVNGAIFQHGYVNKDSTYTNGSFPVEILPVGAARFVNSQRVMEVASLLNKLEPNVYLIRVMVHHRHSDAPMLEFQAGAIGKFYYDNRDGSNYNAFAATANKATLAAAAIPQPKMRNPALEAQMRAYLQKEIDHEILKIVITWADWEPLYHPVSGVHNGRGIETRNLVRDKSGACRVHSVQFFQPKVGAGYGKIYTDTTYGRTDDYPVPCEKIK